VVKKGVVDSLGVGKQYDTQKPSVHLWNWCLAANASALLDGFAHWRFDDVLNPLIADESPIWAKPHGVEILSEFHSAGIAGILLQGKREAA